MKLQFLIPLILLGTIALPPPAHAQRILNDSQTFFQQGQDWLETEIRNLQNPPTPLLQSELMLDLNKPLFPLPGSSAPPSSDNSIQTIPRDN